MSGARAPRVLIVDDHALFRAGVRAELNGRVEVVGEAGEVAAALAAVADLAPDVILLDVHMPDGGGLAVLAGLPATGVPAKALALSVSDAPEDVIAVIRAGARGYVTKSIDADGLVEAITRIAEGDAVFSPRLAGFVLDAFAGDGPGPGSPSGQGELDQLTAREREVLRHIARGYLYKEIALRLGISVKTVETHVGAVLRKLQLSTRHELSSWARERRLVD